MNEFTQNGQEYYVHEDVLRLRERFEIRKTAKQVGLAYLLFFFMPDLLANLVNWIFSFLPGESRPVFFLDPAGQQFYQIVASIVVFILPFSLLTAVAKKRSGKVMSFGRPKKGTLLPYTLIGLGFCAFANVCTSTLGNLVEMFGFTFTQPEGELPEGVFGIILVVVASAVTPALTEEFAMRGAVMGTAKIHGEGFALLVSSILFGILHGNFVQIPFAFVVGLGVGYAVIKSGSMWAGVLIHFLNNFFSVCLDYIREGLSSLAANSMILIYFALCFACFFVGLLLLKDKDDWKLTEPEGVLTFGNRISTFFSSPYMVISVVITLLSSLTYVVKI